MIVYAVLVYSGDGYELDEVFDTEEKAEDHVKEQKYLSYNYRIVEKVVR